jgi:pimeloyl-ACP methyl ester carboxylesterase
MMPDDSRQPTLILVHGAGHGSWCWETVQSLASERGLRTVALDLPSSAETIADLGSADDDIRVVREACAAAGEPVVLVGHSLAGMTISEAAAGLSEVRELVYVAAFMLEEGETIVGAASQWPPIDWVFSDDGRSVGVSDPASVFYGACSPEVSRAAMLRLRPQDAAGAIRPLGAAAWRTIPSTYVVCERDAVVPASFQRDWATRVAFSESLDADHSPFLSRPEELVAVLAAAAARAAGSSD